MSGSAILGIVGAYGATGRAVVAELLRSTEDEILLGGRDSAKLEACAAEFGSRVSCSNMDIQDSRALDEFCRGCSVVVNCGGPVMVLQERVAQAALRGRCHYIDPAGMSLVKERMLPHHQEMVDRELSFVVSAGWMPGITELLPIHAHSRAQAQMDSVHAMEVYFSDSGEWSESALRDGVAYLRTLRLGVFKAGYFRKGEWVRARTFEASRKVDVGGPIGLRRFSLVYMPELNEVGRRLTRCDFRSYSYLACFQNALDAMTIALIPLSAEAAVRRLRSIFRRNQTEVGGFVIVRVQGRVQGRDAVFRSCVTFDAGRGYWMNAVALATGARLIARGEGVRTGVHFLFDAVEPAVMMSELQRAGVQLSESMETEP